ncbi:DNA primase [Alkalilimnicola sp. S0819]|uniref:DNA primase n=1 Tax=Alkalilimnicola sp. S0819 TaxID=2613922 RepID=UPI00126159DB|nr:DNA primase [Alkalilimnicola sp. S0819]KAB7627299.1 DNA primase [Alkalilimnicola sp. S0819]MPQ16013.1 DNA primase [Alkalilimnicola sp. S0819]
MAGRIPEQFIDEVVNRTDVVELVGARVKLKKAGRNYSGLCPFHNERTPSFTVAPDKQFYHCFGCGAHGNAIQFLMEYERMEFRDAVELLARQAGLEMPREVQGAGPRPQHEQLYRLLGQAAQSYQRWLREHPERARAVDYLKGRGLSGEIAQRYAMGYAPPGWDNLLRQLGQSRPLVEAGLLIEKDGGRAYDRFRDRIMFPIRDRRGRVVGFGGRVLGDEQPKYLNSPETPVYHKGQELYGLYECLQARRHPEKLLVVEGYMDVVALAQFGIDYAVATLGTATTTRQVERLFQVSRDVVFCFDGDRAGRDAAWRALENALPAIRDGRQAFFQFLPEGEDPDSLVRRLGAEGFAGVLAKARPLSEFFFDHLAEDTDLKSMDGRARVAEKAGPLLRKLPPSVFRDMMLQRLAELTGLDAQRVEDQLAAAARPAPAATPAAGSREERRRQGQRIQRTPVRLAVALLLQRPELAAQVQAPRRFRDSGLPGMQLLADMLELLEGEPQLSSGALLERFRGSAHEAALWKLAVWDPMVPEAGVDKEFRDTLTWLETSVDRQRLQELDEKLARNQLAGEELQEWQALIKRLKGRSSDADNPS